MIGVWRLWMRGARSRRVRVATWTGFWLCVSGLGLMALAYAVGVRYVTTPSVRVGLWIERAPADAAALPRQTYVMFCATPRVEAEGLARGYLATGVCPGGSAPLIKRIVAVGGDHVEVTRAGLVINGRVEPHSSAFTLDTKGRVLSVLRGAYVVRPNRYWVLGDIDRSWDSRYWGPIDAAQVTGVASFLLPV